jgi:hypothetical protein
VPRRVSPISAEFTALRLSMPVLLNSRKTNRPPLENAAQMTGPLRCGPAPRTPARPARRSGAFSRTSRSASATPAPPPGTTRRAAGRCVKLSRVRGPAGHPARRNPLGTTRRDRQRVRRTPGASRGPGRDRLPGAVSLERTLVRAGISAASTRAVSAGIAATAAILRARTPPCPSRSGHSSRLSGRAAS